MKKKQENTKIKKISKWKIGAVVGICAVAIFLLIVLLKVKSNMQEPNEQVVSINEMLGKTASKKVVKIQDANGDIFYLPKGFKISDNTSEQTVKEGIVIIDNTGDKETNGSEFVWIPVETVNNDVFNIKELKYRTLDYSLVKESKASNEYANIQNSISMYKGFYISRYEAGISSKMEEKLLEAKMLEDQTIIKDTTNDFANGKYKPISKANATVWNFIKWGGTLEEVASDGLAGADEANGAVKVARNMYNNSKTSVKSNLCYGYEWEFIMNFIDSGYYNNQCNEESVIINSSSKGNYNNTLSKTASDTTYCQKNIYDLAGNVWEWTMTGYEDLYRVTRGGSYSTRGDFFSIASEKEFYPSDYYKEIGFRVALWIN